jgi:F420-0:gamma-glutamyl ligase
MTERKNLDELLSVLERVRAEKYSDVPKELIEQIAYIQYDNQDNRQQARSKTMSLIAEYMNRLNSKEA